MDAVEPQAKSCREVQRQLGLRMEKEGIPWLVAAITVPEMTWGHGTLYGESMPSRSATRHIERRASRSGAFGAPQPCARGNVCQQGGPKTIRQCHGARRALGSAEMHKLQRPTSRSAPRLRTGFWRLPNSFASDSLGQDSSLGQDLQVGKLFAVVRLRDLEGHLEAEQFARLHKSAAWNPYSVWK